MGKVLENELKIIKEHNLFYLFGYYEVALKEGLMIGWRNLTKEEIEQIIDAYWEKTKKAILIGR